MRAERFSKTTLGVQPRLPGEGPTDHVPRGAAPKLNFL